MKRNILKTFLYTLPILVLLITNAYFLPYGKLSELLGWIKIPGVVMALVISPTWRTLHAYEYVFVVTSYVFYYVMVYLIVICISWFKKRGS